MTPSSSVVTIVIRTATTRLRVMFMSLRRVLARLDYASPSAVITTSMALIPMNGTMTPPTP